MAEGERGKSVQGMTADGRSGTRLPKCQRHVISFPLLSQHRNRCSQFPVFAVLSGTRRSSGFLRVCLASRGDVFKNPSRGLICFRGVFAEGITMFGLETSSTPAVPVGLPPPSNALPARQDHRAVEPTTDDAQDGIQSDLSYSPSRAVLQLLRRSAEDFATLVERGTEPESAAAMTGSPSPGPGVGSFVDAYA